MAGVPVNFALDGPGFKPVEDKIDGIADPAGP